MTKASQFRILLFLLGGVLTFAAPPISAKPSGAPAYVVLLSRGTHGGSASGQYAITQHNYPYPGAAGLAGFHIAIEEVPGLSVSWSAPGAITLSTLDWNLNPKERAARAAFRFTTPGLYTATCTLTYSWPGGPQSIDIDFLVIGF